MLILGTLLGDYLGSPYEGGFGATGREPLPTHGSRFTDDSVLTVAVADWLSRGNVEDITGLRDLLQQYWRTHPNCGYGDKFASWAQFRTKESYQSYGNGAPMRVALCGWKYGTWKETLHAAYQSCRPTHDHKDSYDAAQAVVGMIYLGRLGWSLPDAVRWSAKHFHIPLRTAEAWHDNVFYVDARNTTGLALSVLRELELGTDSFERMVRAMLYIGGDVDTNCAIAGSILEAWQPLSTEDTEGLCAIISPAWTPFLDIAVSKPKPLSLVDRYFTR